MSYHSGFNGPARWRPVLLPVNPPRSQAQTCTILYQAMTIRQLRPIEIMACCSAFFPRIKSFSRLGSGCPQAGQSVWGQCLDGQGHPIGEEATGDVGWTTGCLGSSMGQTGSLEISLNGSLCAIWMCSVQGLSGLPELGGRCRPLNTGW